MQKKLKLILMKKVQFLMIENIEGVASIFFGPGFITITKEENIEWTSITQDIINIFDKL